MTGDASTAILEPEQAIWEGHPSQVTEFWWYVACILIIPIPIAIWKWLVVRNTRYEVTTERIRTKTGILNRSTDEIELYRVRDYRVEEPFFLRMFGLANIELVTSDKSHPHFTLRAIKRADWLRDQIRVNVEKARLVKRVREIDME